VVVRLFEEPRWVQLYPRVLRSLRSLRYPRVNSVFVFDVMMRMGLRQNQMAGTVYRIEYQ